MAPLPDRDEPEAGWRKTRALLPLLPALILVLVAGHQLYLFHSAQLSPWKGGGFGMFSSNVAGWTRHSHLFVRGSEAEVELELPEELEDAEERLLALPRDARLAAFARELSESVRESHPHRALRIEVWSQSFDPADLRPHIELLREYRYEVEPDDG